MSEVFWRFLGLGCVSFGGPVAHIAYFRTAFVEQHGWLSEQEFMTRLSLCNLLPGPTSSQLGFAIGHYRAGIAGAIAAFIGFTLPSFLIMWGLASVLFGQLGYVASDQSLNHSVFGVIGGLKLAALVVVVDALLAMLLTFCRSYVLLGLAVIAFLWFAFAPFAVNPLVPMLLGGMAHWWYRRLREGSVRRAPALSGRPTKARCWRVAGVPRITWLAVSGFALMLLGSLLNSERVAGSGIADLFLAFYQVGASTFGGGHVVLPLLFGHLGHLVSEDVLLTAYASAQAVPGPMFTIAAFLGVQIAQSDPASSSLAILSAGLVATMGIFLPGFLLLAALLPIWHKLSAISSVAWCLAGINAMVVGLLAAALSALVAPSALGNWLDLGVAVSLFVLMRFARLPVWAVLLACMAFGVVR